MVAFGLKCAHVFHVVLLFAVFSFKDTRNCFFLVSCYDILLLAGFICCHIYIICVLALRVSLLMALVTIIFLVSIGSNVQGGPAKVRPTLLVTFECVGKIQ